MKHNKAYLIFNNTTGEVEMNKLIITLAIMALSQAAMSAEKNTQARHPTS
jgi:hypothetical protein